MLVCSRQLTVNSRQSHGIRTIHLTHCSINTQDIDHTVLWYDRGSHATYNQSHLESTSTTITEEDYLACVTIKHCEDTALIGTEYLDEDSNGYVDLAVNRLSPDQVFILLFSAILFGR